METTSFVGNQGDSPFLCGGGEGSWRGGEGSLLLIEGVTLVLGTKGREELYCMVTEIHNGLKYLLVTIVPCVEEVRDQGRRSTFVVLGENTS